MQFHKTANANCATFSTVIKLYTVHVQTTIADFKLISYFFMVEHMFIHHAKNHTSWDVEKISNKDNETLSF